MNHRKRTITLCIWLAFPSILLSGCGDAGPIDERAAGVTGHGDHAHLGPHDGEVIELGSPAYHAEIVRDAPSGAITIYVLDGAATSPATIDARTITINVAHDSEPKQYVLAATPEPNDTEGRSSRFASTDVELSESLDQNPQAEVVLSIDGKQYRGTIPAGHDPDHDHAHDHNHDHDHDHGHQQ